LVELLDGKYASAIAYKEGYLQQLDRKTRVVIIDW
jgi:hypothetical protein